MASKFPDTPSFTGYNAPMRVESDIRDLEVVSGDVPRDLNGSFYRATHDPQFPPRLGDDIYVNGDGMISYFRFENGHVDFKSRYVRTDRYRAQEAARRSLFGVYRNRYTNDPSVEGVDSGTANTTPIWHGRKLLALKEDSPPWELDPHSLETIGKWDYGGDLKAVSMTAHPKLDYRTGELLFFAYQAKGDATTDVVFYTADKDGHITHEVWFNAPYPGLVHDFAATEDHIVFPFFPLITDLDVLKAGGPFYQWDGTRESVFAILPRKGRAEDIKWFRGPASFAAHMMNAFTEGSKVSLDLCLSAKSSFPFFPNRDGTPFDRQGARSKLVRLTFDLESNDEAYQSEVIFPELCEMPRTDDRYQTMKHKHGYLIFHDPNRPTNAAGHGTTLQPRNSIGHIDFTTGAHTAFHAGDDTTVQEPIFVPRSADSAEGDGYLLAVLDRVKEMRSDLVILDAMKPEDGPVALIKMPIRQRPAAHGNWVSADALETGVYR